MAVLYVTPHKASLPAASAQCARALVRLLARLLAPLLIILACLLSCLLIILACLLAGLLACLLGCSLLLRCCLSFAASARTFTSWLYVSTLVQCSVDCV